MYLVFQKRREINLKIQLDKTDFLNKETAFIGHIVSRNWIKPNIETTKTVKVYQIPRT